MTFARPLSLFAAARFALSRAVAVVASLALLGAAATTAANAAPRKAVAHSKGSQPAANAWLNKIAVSPQGGHVVGNPAAPQRVVEFMSYTCSHCAHFEMESELPLRSGPISAGTLSFEVRHLLRDPIDVTIAMLTNCVPPVRFFPLHHRFLADQAKWFAVAQKMTPEQMKRWNNGQMPERMRAIASDLKFYDMAASAGLSRGQAEGCLANEGILRRIVEQTKQAEGLGINSTPSFVLNDKVIEAHDWAGLQAALTNH